MKINFVRSPNFYKKRLGYKPQRILIVNHITEGRASSCINWFQNPKSQASTHFLVAKNGTITQFVDLKDAAWGNGTNADEQSSLFYGKARNRFVRETAINANLYTVSIEHEGIYKETHGKLTEEQYQATLRLHKHIIDEIYKLYGIEIRKDRDHIIGHIDVTPISRPHCPGELFPFGRLIEDLNKKEVEEMKRYNKIGEVPTWAKDTVQKLIDKGALRGDGGNLNLSEDMLRVFVINDRMGLYQ